MGLAPLARYPRRLPLRAHLGWLARISIAIGLLSGCAEMAGAATDDTSPRAAHALVAASPHAPATPPAVASPAVAAAIDDGPAPATGALDAVRGEIESSEVDSGELERGELERGEVESTEAAPLASIVGRHETPFDPSDEARVANLRLAVEAIDGTSIRPRRSLSFDEALGPRTEARGYRAAEEIIAGELRPGIGGGICQVATTLFVAAYRGGLTISDVHSHSRLPPYARPGMDAVIAEGQRDLVVVNSYPEAVVVHARLEGDRVIVELETEATPYEVTYSAEVEDEFPIRERIERTRRLPSGEREVLDHGEIGRVVYRTRTVRDADGELVGRDRRHVRYHAMPRIIREGR